MRSLQLRHPRASPHALSPPHALILHLPAAQNLNLGPRYKEDVALMREMGVKYYRLSMSWARIFPNGKGKANERGVALYDRLLTE